LAGKEIWEARKKMQARKTKIVGTNFANLLVRFFICAEVPVAVGLASATGLPLLFREV